MTVQCRIHIEQLHLLVALELNDVLEPAHMIQHKKSVMKIFVLEEKKKVKCGSEGNICLQNPFSSCGLKFLRCKSIFCKKFSPGFGLKMPSSSPKPSLQSSINFLMPES